jgi:DNA repair ATPase RecN
MAPKQPTTTNALLEKLVERLDGHLDSISKGQGTLSDKVDDLSDAYTNLATRLVNIEAKDFETTVTRIQESTHKLLLLEKLNEKSGEKIDHLEERIEITKEKMEKLESKIERFHLYINIVAFVIVSVVMPLFVTWLSKVVFAGPAAP